MKTTWIASTILACAGLVYFAIPSQQASAQTGGAQAAGTPPIGRVVEIELVAWPLGTQQAGKVRGNLLSMTGDWIVVKDGSFENWIPKEKILVMKASR